MSNVIKIKRSAVASNVPTIAQLLAGELAMNTADGRMFFGTGTSVIELMNKNGVIPALGYTPLNVAGDTMTGNLNLNGHEVTGLPSVPTTSSSAASKAYVDSALFGLRWTEPVEIINLIGNTSTVPSGPLVPDAYIIDVGGATGAWSTFSVGDVVQWNGSSWIKIHTLDLDDAFIIAAFTATVPVGDCVGKRNFIGRLSDVTIGNLVWNWTSPVDKMATFVHLTTAHLFGRQFTYSSITNSWTEFGAAPSVDAGAGLSFSGNQINIGTASSNRIVVNADNIDLGTTGIVPGTYCDVTVDVYGRIVSGSNPIASNSITGMLSSTDWNTFNGKQSSLGYTPMNVAGDTMTGPLTLNADPTTALHAATKQYVDGQRVWLPPVDLSNLIGSSTTPVASTIKYDAYIIDVGGATGAWSSFSVGDIVQWSGSAWLKVKAVEVGDKYIISGKTGTTPIGFASGKNHYYAVMTVVTPGSLQATWTAPVDGFAAFVHNPVAKLYGHSYAYIGESINDWLELGTAVNSLDPVGNTTVGGPTIDMNGSISFPKTFNTGILIDSTYGWHDLLGPVNPLKSGGANNPVWAMIRTNMWGWLHSAGDIGDCLYHVPHNWAPTTDMHLHAHWTHNGTGISGSLVITYYITAAKRGVAFPAVVTTTMTKSGITIISNVQYCQALDEVQFSAASPTANQINTNILEVDALINVRYVVTTVPTVTGPAVNGVAPGIFISTIDIHYQSNGMATRNKDPNFYA